jgi:hypothetical protein
MRESDPRLVRIDAALADARQTGCEAGFSS